jgi:hypothetical protein
MLRENEDSQTTNYHSMPKKKVDDLYRLGHQDEVLYENPTRKPEGLEYS